MLPEVSAIEKVIRSDGLRVDWIVYMNIEVTGNDEVVNGGGGSGKKQRFD